MDVYVRQNPSFDNNIMIRIVNNYIEDNQELSNYEYHDTQILLAFKIKKWNGLTIFKEKFEQYHLFKYFYNYDAIYYLKTFFKKYIKHIYIDFNCDYHLYFNKKCKIIFDINNKKYKGYKTTTKLCDELNIINYYGENMNYIINNKKSFVKINIITDDIQNVLCNIIKNKFINDDTDFVSEEIINNYIDNYVKTDVETDGLVYIINNFENITYNLFQKILHKNNIKNDEDYLKYCEHDLRLPRDPAKFFKDFNWVEATNTEDLYYKKDECIKFINKEILRNKFRLKLHPKKYVINLLCKKYDKVPSFNIFINIYGDDSLNLIRYSKPQLK